MLEESFENKRKIKVSGDHLLDPTLGGGEGEGLCGLRVEAAEFWTLPLGRGGRGLCGLWAGSYRDIPIQGCPDTGTLLYRDTCI